MRGGSEATFPTTCALQPVTPARGRDVTSTLDVAVVNVRLTPENHLKQDSLHPGKEAEFESFLRDTAIPLV